MFFMQSTQCYRNPFVQPLLLTQMKNVDKLLGKQKSYLSKPRLEEAVKTFLEAEVIEDPRDKHLFSAHCGDVLVPKESPFHTYRELFQIAEIRARNFGIDPGDSFSKYLVKPDPLPAHLNLPQPVNMFAGRLKKGLYKVYVKVSENKLAFSFYYFSRPELKDRPGPKQFEFFLDRPVKVEEPA